MKSSIISAVFFALLLVACGGAEATVAPTAAPTQTPLPTSTPMPLVPVVLLEDIKVAMAGLQSFTLEGDLELKTSEEADKTLLAMQISGVGYVKGDNQVSIVMDVDTVGFVGKITVLTREVDGVKYAQDFLTGEWSIDEQATDVEDEDFVPKGLVATAAVREDLSGLSVYRVTGTVPDEPENEEVVLWVSTEDLLVRQIRQKGHVSAEDYASLLTGETGNLFQSFVTKLSNLNEPVQVVAPQLKEAPKAAKQYPEAPSMTIEAGATYVATMRTNMGDVILELFAIEAPETVNSFIFLANEGFYDDVIFHRVIENFMVQTGDPTGVGSGGSGYTYADEFVPSLVFDRIGVLAMANSGPNTNSSQFFITTVPTPHLNGAHTIFGQVIEGQEIVDAISKVATEAGNRPTQPVIILGIDISNE